MILFNNGPAPKNPLISVGLQFDIRKYPNRNIPPEEEFRAMISRFQLIEDLHQITLDNTDTLVNGFYISWRDWNLFNAWLRIWYTTGVLGFFHIEAAYSNYKRTRNKEKLWQLLNGTHVGSFVSAFDAYQPYFAEAGRLIRAVDSGALSPGECTEKRNALVKSVDFLPPGFNFADLSKKTGGPFTREHWESIIRWGNYEAPKEVKESLYRGDPAENVSRFMKRIDESLVSPHLQPIRDFLKAEGGPQVRHAAGEPQVRRADHGPLMRKVG